MADLIKSEVRVIGFNGPLSTKGVETFIPGGQTISEAFPNLSSQVFVTVNGNPTPEKQYSEKILTADDLVVMLRMPAGDTDTRKEMGRTAFIITLQLAAAKLTAGASLAVQAGAQIAATYGGNYVAKKIGLVTTPDIRNTERDTTEFDRRGALTGSKNKLAPFSVVPRVYGHMRMYPPMAAKPYTEVMANEQYMRLIFTVGRGPVQLGKPKQGQTKIGTFKAA